MKPTTETQRRDDESHGTLKICLYYGVATGKDQELRAALEGGLIRVFDDLDGECGSRLVDEKRTESDGCIAFSLPAADYWLELPHTGCADRWVKQGDSLDKKKRTSAQEDPYGSYAVAACGYKEVAFFVPKERSGLAFNYETWGAECAPIVCSNLVAGKRANLKFENTGLMDVKLIHFLFNNKPLSTQSGASRGTFEIALNTAGIATGDVLAEARVHMANGTIIRAGLRGMAGEEIQTISGEIKTTTTLTRTATSLTKDMALWMAIINSTEELSFNSYLRFMDWIFCGGEPPSKGFEAGRFPVKQDMYVTLQGKRFLPFTDADAYRVVKAATEAFVMVNCGVRQPPLPFDPNRDDAYLDRRDLPIPEVGLTQTFTDYLVSVNGDKTLPYLAAIRRKLPDIPIRSTSFANDFPQSALENCFGLLQEKLTNPCLLELIWSYWHEEGMLVQTVNAITRRFQNVRAPTAQDPLSNLEMDPLRPLNNLFWGYIQDEQHRLTVGRRNYEYDHHYGLRLEGKAVQNFRPVDTRSKFLEAFHHLLRLCTVFYKQDDDTTVKADAFPVLNALKEVHLILSEGAHNQFGDLPSTARIEMLMQEWLLARPEFREFLPTRIMVAYPEPWMDRVDAMKKLQGWTDTSVLQFRNLGMFGEQLLLSIRWGHWSDEFEPLSALNWARFFRPQVQGYIHAYRAATGVDLAADPTVDTRVDSTLPSVLLQKRLARQQRTG